MGALTHFLKNTVAAFLAVVWFSIPAAGAAEARLDRLYDRLQTAEPAEAKRIGDEILLALSHSGSAAMDLLLKRGRDALEAGETEAAIGHFTALTDHAPHFAEGWHLRAVALTRAELYGPALEDLERALTLEPRHFAAIHGLGILMEEVGRTDLARDAYRRVLEIHPHYEDVGEALKRLGGVLDGADL